MLELKDHDESHRIQDAIYTETFNICGENVSQMSSTEKAILYEIAAGLHQQPETKGYLLEFGTWGAVSGITLCEGALRRGDDYPVITVDPYYPDDTGESAEKYVQSHDVYYKYREGQIRDNLIRVISPDLVYMKTWTQPIRLVFIDSSHHYDHTRDEIEAILPFLTDDSWIVFHDYHQSRGVVPAVNEFLENQTEWEIKPYQLGAPLSEDHLLIGLHMLQRINID